MTLSRSATRAGRHCPCSRIFLQRDLCFDYLKFFFPLISRQGIICSAIRLASRKFYARFIAFSKGVRDYVYIYFLCLVFVERPCRSRCCRTQITPDYSFIVYIEGAIALISVYSIRLRDELVLLDTAPNIAT